MEISEGKDRYKQLNNVTLDWQERYKLISAERDQMAAQIDANDDVTAELELEFQAIQARLTKNAEMLQMQLDEVRRLAQSRWLREWHR